MVNLDKWEEIAYGDIKRNDLIRCIIVQGNVIDDVRGKVDWHDGIGVYNDLGVRFITSPEMFKPKSGGQRTIYRRKPKPFTFPTNTTAIIRGQRVGHDSVTVFFVKLHSGWHHESGSIYSKDEIEMYFRNFEVVYKGVKSD